MSDPPVVGGALSLATDAEKAAVLGELLASDRDLELLAERAARALLARVDTGAVADAVLAVLLALGQEDLSARVGRTRYGYVEPTEAAWQLPEQAVESWLEDIGRRASLGLVEPARRLGLGVLQGLRTLEDFTGDDDLLLGWAPDFLGETVDRVVGLLSDLGIGLTDDDGLDA